MTGSQTGTVVHFQTKTIVVATRDALFSFLFHTLLEDGHFTVDASTFHATRSLSSPKDQALLDALASFVAQIPIPTISDTTLAVK